ncbi:hypothetical protein CC1G_03602 [Coprinopsis cinerea okayama7|uniref:Nuclear condensin complex subunit 3 C-terminal domain-containing protein n=1 Tax=Coprinopsis cinerea (strain Okayama-7 / 130 / ATCC MYA-4618 / FGSC 9003) TaxID=240176 RepID=A8NCP4_COPC7|nr:hypothetical protein CC1G_03602 [Coprinopsis cinerea okayama7\|eukprot:XP_001832588.2 hypothetical protein CC1G_03602 [Coprinopsis cinerea okayama7\
MERMEDREDSVRAKVAGCLALLCALDDDPDDETDLAYKALFDALSYDPKAEVRKAVLCSLAIDKGTFPHILDRLRDRDEAVRKAVYQNVLKAKISNVKDEEKEMGPCHPTKLNRKDCLEILKNGLRDRDPSVCTAAELLVKEWIHEFEELEGVKDEPDTEQKRVEAPITALLGKFRLLRTSSANLEVLATMVKCIFKVRQDIFDAIQFGDREYWDKFVEPENAFVMRSFVEYCVENKRTNRVDEVLPTVSELADIIEKRHKALPELYTDDGPKPTYRAQEFILKELLKLAPHLDFSDHRGCRKMQDCMRGMIDEYLTETLTALCMDVLYSVTVNERDFIRIVVDLIHEIRDREGEVDGSPDTQDAESSSGSTQRVPRKDLLQRPRNEMPRFTRELLNEIDLTCLFICRSMLERVQEPVRHYSILNAIIQDVVVPILTNAQNFINADENANSPEYEIHERLFENSLLCLSLASLVYEELAVHTFERFAKTIDKEGLSHSVRMIILQAIFDLVLRYGAKVIPPERKEITLDDIGKTLVEQVSRQSDHPETLAVVCQGLAKLILPGVIQDPSAVSELFRMLILPETADNQPLRQGLQYFFQMYSFSKKGHQEVMKDIFMGIFKEQALKERSDDDEEEEVVSLPRLCEMFEAYTNPLRLKDCVKEDELVDWNVQLQLMKDMLMAVAKDTELKKEHRKVLLQSVARMTHPANLPDGEKVDDSRMYEVKIVIDKIRLARLPQDAVSRNAFNKLEANFTAKYKSQLEGLKDDEMRQLESLVDFFRDVDSIMEDDGDTSGADFGGPRTRGQKRRSMSMATTNSDMEDVKPVIEDLDPPSKRRRVSRADEESEDQSAMGTPEFETQGRADDPIVISSDEEDETEEPPVQARRREPEVIDLVDDEDEDEDEEERVDRSLSRLLSAKGRPSDWARGGRGEEEEENGEDSEEPWDSIMDDTMPPEDSEEEEEEEQGHEQYEEYEDDDQAAMERDVGAEGGRDVSGEWEEEDEEDEILQSLLAPDD